MKNSKFILHNKDHCSNCKHCRIVLKIKKNNVLDTKITPVTPFNLKRKDYCSGVIKIYCRKGQWFDYTGIFQREYRTPQSLFTKGFKQTICSEYSFFGKDE